MQKKENDQGFSVKGVVKNMKAPMAMIRIPIDQGMPHIKNALIRPKCVV